MFCQARNLKFSLIALVLAASALPVRAQGGDPIVTMQTTKGPITIQVLQSMVPTTSANFLDLVSRGFYNGLSFHRVETWCIQGGDPNGNGSGDFINPETGRPRYLRLEINRALHHNVGMVAMARTQNPNSASCQFYIMKARQPMLDGQYAIFGKVLDGMNSVYNIGVGDRITSAQIGGGGGGGNMRSAQPSSSGAIGGSARGYNSNVHSNAGTPTDSGF
jgi:peptidyl-prolyl cis-trans isomerase B (cyclophilin B)